MPDGCRLSSLTRKGDVPVGTALNAVHRGEITLIDSDGDIEQIVDVDHGLSEFYLTEGIHKRHLLIIDDFVTVGDLDAEFPQYVRFDFPE